MGLRRGGIHAVRTVFYIRMVFLSFPPSRHPAVPQSRATRLREAHCRNSAVCAEFESSCNKIRTLCDGLRYPARARVRLVHIYSRKSEMYTGRLRVYGGGIPVPVRLSGYKRRPLHTSHRISPGRCK